METLIRNAVIDDAPRLADLLRGISRTIVTLSTSPNGRMAKSLDTVRCTGYRIFSRRGWKDMFLNYSCVMRCADKELAASCSELSRPKRGRGAVKGYR